MRRPTIADIARRAGISKVAVSYALNGRSGVSEETRGRVLAIAEELHWRPNSAAKALAGAPSRTIGLVIDRPTDLLGTEPFYMELLAGIESVLSPRSYATMLQVVSSETDELAVLRHWWAEQRVDGTFLVDLQIDDPRARQAQEQGIPTVALADPRAASGLPVVWSDEHEPMRQMVAHLAELGHTRISRVAGIPGLIHTRVRDEAFTAACAMLGIEHHEIVHTDYTPEESARQTQRLLAERPQPTALCYDSDLAAVAAIGVAGEMGLEIPGDVSIIGWDDSLLAQIVRPALTTMSRDVHAYGATAAKTLLAVIDGEQVGAVEVAPAALTARGSTGPPPTG